MAILRTLTDELHLHLYGCLTPEDVYELGRERYAKLAERLTWYADEYSKAWGRRPEPRSYWEDASGFDKLLADFVFLGAAPFNRFQACFNLLIALFPVVPDDTTVLRHVLHAQRQTGLRYGEYRCPVPPTMSLSDFAQYVTNAAGATKVIAAESAGSFIPRLAFSLSRTPSLALAQHSTLRDLLSARPELAEVVTAVDFCGAEEGHPPRTMVEVFRQIHAANRSSPNTALAILYHVGESFSQMSIQSAMRWVYEAHTLGAHRLGHAIALGLVPESLLDRGITSVSESALERTDHLRWLLATEPRLAARGYHMDAASLRSELTELAEKTAPDARVTIPLDDAYFAASRHLQDALMGELANTGAVIESCPTSNFRLGEVAQAHHHPLPRLFEAGLTVTVSTDDPGIFRIALGDEEDLCRTVLGFKAQDLRAMQQAAERHRSGLIAGRSSC